MVIGKLKYWIELRPEYTPYRLELVPMWPGHMRSTEPGSVLQDGGPIP